MRDKSHDSYFEALTFEEFQSLSSEYHLVPIYKEIPADLLTTSVLYEKLSAAFSGESFILESIGRLNNPQKAETIWWGRYTYLGFDPMVIYRGKGSQIDITSRGQTQSIDTQQPYEFLRTEMQKYAGMRAQYMPVLWGGMVGYCGFPASSQSSESLPDFAFMIPGILIGIEHKRSRMQIITFAQIDSNAQLQQQYDDANARIDRVIEIIQQPQAATRTLLDIHHDTQVIIETGDLDALRAAAKSEFEKHQLHYLKLLKVVDVETVVSAH
ncbi:MAG TPA: hypothetical protein VJZ27_07545, partial [Aggregatilineales bacterium]|nr:hypothetical protein [Aggregatilineales bacterium]